MPELDYLGWSLENALDPMLEWPAQLNRLLESVSWDTPDDPGTQRGWLDVEALCDHIFAVINKLITTPPPFMFISAHRAVIQAGIRFVSGILDIISILVAPSIEVGQRLAAKSTAAFALAGRTAKFYNQALRFIRPSPVEGRIVLSLSAELAVGKLSIADFFPELRSVVDTEAILLEPLKRQLAAAAIMQDPTRRERRVAAAYGVLARADDVVPDWVEEPGRLAEEAQRAWDQQCRQHQRLMREITTIDNPYVMDSMLDIFSKLCEGPFRRYGSIISIAGKASEDGSLAFNQDGLFAMRSLTAVYGATSKYAPPLSLGVDRLLRNAEAHYDYTVTASTVKFRHFPPNARSAGDAVEDEMTNDDIIEQTANLLESSLAIALALLRWASTNSKIAIREAFRAGWLEPSLS